MLIASSSTCALVAVSVTIAILAFRGDSKPEPSTQPNRRARHDSLTKRETTQPQNVNKPKKNSTKPPVPLANDFAAVAPKVEARLNHHRRLAGLDAVRIDPVLCAVCARQANKHALGEDVGHAYLVVPAIGKAAAEWCLANVDARAALLDPHLAKIGLAHSAGTAGGSVTVFDLTNGTKKAAAAAIIYPAEGQKDVPLSYAGNEIPDPIPKATKPSAGYPVTVTFRESAKIRGASGRLQVNGKDVPIWFSSPSKPANPKFGPSQGTTICLFPIDELPPATAFTASVSAEVDGQEWQKTWSFTTTNRRRITEDYVPEVLKKINGFRRQAGAAPVELEMDLTRAAQDHASYLARNEDLIRKEKRDLHAEDPKLPGYVKKAAELAQYADVGQALYAAPLIVDEWMGTLNYRTPLLAPHYEKVGIGIGRGPRFAYLVFLPAPFRLRPTPKPPTIYPHDKQADVPTHYDSGEYPDPIPDSKDRLAGFPITVHFYYGVEVKQVRATLKRNGKDVPFWMKTPENPVAKGFQRHTVCLIAKRPLQPGASYQVAVQARVNDQPWGKSWQFTTKAHSPEERANQGRVVVAALNNHRQRAGLGPVSFDDKLSKGCYAHADYLLRNWGHPAIQGLGIHEEDETLPGYSKDGQEAGRAAVILTGNPPADAIDDWMASLYHRTPLLDPRLARIGVGYVAGGPDNWIVVVDVQRGLGDPHVIVYPAPNQTDVPLHDHENRAGFPITMTFPARSIIQPPKVTVRDGNGNRVKVELVVSDRFGKETDRPITIGALPHAALQPGRTYVVEAEARVAGASWNKKWSFTTTNCE